MKTIPKLKMILLLFLITAFGIANAQVDRTFVPRFSTNEFGNISLVGNVLLTCDAANTNCAEIQNGTTSGGNNNQSMAFINIDSAAGFSNSSSADMNLPTGSTILFAGMYWAGRAEENDINRETIQLRTPELGSTYEAVNAIQIDTFSSQGEIGSRPYQAYADVTAQVQAGGNGTYFAGDLTAELGSDGLGFFGGWSLIVAYRDVNQPFRRLVIYDGAARISGTNNVDVTVTGLLTPSAPGFETFLGALVWEGDEFIENDAFEFEGNILSDTLNENTNFWNSSITNQENRVTTKDPDYVNQLAMDLDYIDVSGLLGTGATEADIRFSTNGDTYFPHVLTFATDLFVPDLVSSLSKTANDLNGGNIESGDVIEYTIVFENTGQDGATNTILTDNIPANTTYVPATINVTSADVGPSGVQNDTIGTGLCGYNGTAVICGLGAGASNGNGGTFLQNEGATFTFQVTVDVNAPAGDITNIVDVLHNSQTFPSDNFNGSANAVITLPTLPALTTLKSLTNNADGDASGDVTEGDVLTFTVTVTNTGNIPLNNMTASDSMISPSSNNCGTIAPLGTCVLVGTYTVTANDVLAGSFNNTGTGSSDETPNIDDVVMTPVDGTPALTTSKALTSNADGDASGDVTEGDVLTFTVTVTNTGNIPLNNMTASDSMISPSSNNCGTVAPLGICVLVGTYTVTANDALAGSFNNTGTGSSNETPNVDDIVMTSVGGTPALTTTKALTSNADGDASGDVTEGDVLTFTVTVTNTGNIPLNNMTASDSMISPSSNNCGTVAPLGICVLVGTYTVTANDALAGSFNNTGTGSSNETPNVDDIVMTSVGGTPALTTTKALTSNADGDASGDISEGDVLTFTITVTNTGNITLNNVIVTDSMITPSSHNCITLIVGANCQLVGTYMVQQSDIDNGEITNTGTGDSDETQPITDIVVIPLTSNPDLSIEKNITSNADEDLNNTITLGDTITFTIIATNTGDVTLNNVVVEDNMIMPDSITCITVPINNTCTLIGTYMIQQSDVDNGQLINIATVGSDETGQQSDIIDLQISVGLPPEPVIIPSTDFWSKTLLIILLLIMGMIISRKPN